MTAAILRLAASFALLAVGVLCIVAAVWLGKGLAL